MRAAIYARVSTDRQEREQTIDSQMAAVQEWLQAHSHTVADAHLYCDQGFSGARLDRPALDRLRDDVQTDAFDLIAVLSPDRLARKYTAQVLLLEEFRRAGCQVVFVQHPLSDDPHDQLLLQIQGAIAEYERAVIAERFRRGKLHQARAGQVVWNKPAYGYGYIPKRDGCPGHLVIDEAEAAVVRLLYRWLIDERLTVRQLLKRLAAGPWRPRSGKTHWSAATVHHILADPIYTGTAYVNRYAYTAPVKPRRPDSPRAREASCRHLKPAEEWIAVPVPAIIDQAAHDQAQAQLARNSALSFRNNTKYTYLLRCLLTCAHCGLAMFGVTQRTGKAGTVRRTYQCHGKDPVLRHRATACPRRAIKAEELEVAVWAHVTHLLADPARLLAQFERFASLAVEGDAHEQAETAQLTARLARLDREERRLVDAYQAEVISLEELAERRQQLQGRRRGLDAQREQQAQLRRERAQAQAVLTDLTAFCDRVRGRLAEATLAERQTILQLLLERIIVGDDTLEVRHVIPLRGPDPDPARPGPSGDGLRSDGVGPTHLAALQWDPTVGRPAIADQVAREAGPEHALDHLAAATARHHEHRQQGGHHRP
jgi:site-specific DNA recombinase